MQQPPNRWVTHLPHRSHDSRKFDLEEVNNTLSQEMYVSEKEELMQKNSLLEVHREVQKKGKNKKSAFSGKYSREIAKLFQFDSERERLLLGYIVSILQEKYDNEWDLQLFVAWKIWYSEKKDAWKVFGNKRASYGKRIFLSGQSGIPDILLLLLKREHPYHTITEKKKARIFRWQNIFFIQNSRNHTEIRKKCPQKIFWFFPYWSGKHKIFSLVEKRRGMYFMKKSKKFKNILQKSIFSLYCNRLLDIFSFTSRNIEKFYGECSSVG